MKRILPHLVEALSLAHFPNALSLLIAYATVFTFSSTVSASMTALSSSQMVSGHVLPPTPSHRPAPPPIQGTAELRESGLPNRHERTYPNRRSLRAPQRGHSSEVGKPRGISMITGQPVICPRLTRLDPRWTSPPPPGFVWQVWRVRLREGLLWIRKGIQQPTISPPCFVFSPPINVALFPVMDVREKASFRGARFHSLTRTCQIAE